MNNENISTSELLHIIKNLRSTPGCPWDRKQTAMSLKKYLIEEVEELLEAINSNDTENICEEIGDVIYVLAMISEIHSEQGLFNFNDSLTGINEKLVRRHPHVFANKTIQGEDELREQWENIKKEEKKRNN